MLIGIFSFSYTPFYRLGFYYFFSIYKLMFLMIIGYLISLQDISYNVYDHCCELNCVLPEISQTPNSGYV